MKTRTKQQTPIVALEICRSQLQAVILRPQGGDSPPAVEARTIVWRQEAPSLASELGVKELTAALRQLIADERIGGQKVSLCLSGDFCVTRAVTGTNNDVRRELIELEERSSLYLSLGAGPKAIAVSVRQIDARHQHGLITVTNKKVLDTAIAVVSQVGFEIDRIEPSLVALSRLMGHAGQDTQSPVMLIALSEGGAELGVSHQGHLLLNYQPGGRSSTGEVANVTEQHLTRMQRYCHRHVQLAGLRLQQVFLCGLPEAVAAAQAGFAGNQNLRADALDLNKLGGDWQFTDTAHDNQAPAALGMALTMAGSDAEHVGPNLMERIRAQARERLWPVLWRSAWPVAAAAAIAAAALSCVMYEKIKCDSLNGQLADLGPAQVKIAELQERMATAESSIRHLEVIKQDLSNPAWEHVLSTVGHCMPEDVWLESIVSNNTGHLTLSGASYGQDGLYEFVRWLQTTPGLSEVALEQTHPTTVSTGPATGFDLSAEFADSANSAGKEK